MMIFTMTIISPPILLWSPTNGDDHILLRNIELYTFLKLYAQGDAERRTGLSRTAHIQARTLFEEWKNRQFSQRPVRHWIWVR